MRLWNVGADHILGVKLDLPQERFCMHERLGFGLGIEAADRSRFAPPL
jgi:hypothetical protein